MSIGILTIHLRFSFINSLKSKRSLIKPLIIQLRREFNISTAKINLNDKCKEAIIGIVIISNSKQHCLKVLQRIIPYIENKYPDIYILNSDIELL